MGVSSGGGWDQQRKGKDERSINRAREKAKKGSWSVAWWASAKRKSVGEKEKEWVRGNE